MSNAFMLAVMRAFQKPQAKPSKAKPPKANTSVQPPPAPPKREDKAD